MIEKGWIEATRQQNRERAVSAVIAMSDALRSADAEIDRLTRERDEAREALQIAADSFRSHGFAVDADEAEAALAGTAVQPSAGPTYRQVGVRKTHDRCDFFWWESLPEGTAVYVADTAPAPAPQPTVADLHSKRVREIMECNDPLNARDLYGPADNAAAPAPQPARSLLREATIATAPKPGSGPANLVVTRNGVPVPDQKQGVEDFKAACVRPADNAAAPAPQPWGAHILDSWECIHGRRFDAGCAECASLPGAADNGTPAP